MLIALAVRNRSAHKLHDLQFCVQHSTRLHSPDADTTCKTIHAPFPSNSAQSFGRPHVVLAQIIRIFVAGCLQWRVRDSGKNYCLAFLFAFYCCHLPPIVLPALHFLFHFFFVSSFYCYVIKFLARSSSTVRFDESLSCSCSCSASPLSLCCLNARQIAAVRLLFRP